MLHARFCTRLGIGNHMLWLRQRPKIPWNCTREEGGMSEEGRGAVKISPVAFVISAVVCGWVGGCEKSKDLEPRPVVFRFMVFWYD